MSLRHVLPTRPWLRLPRRHFSSTCASVSASSLREIARAGEKVASLELCKSPDLVCRQLMCEHVGDACACRLALALERVPRLLQLNLRDNQLRALPDAVFALQKLQTLDVQRNRLQQLPAEVQNLAQLETLDLRHNALQTLPIAQLETLQKLRTLKVAGNPELLQTLQTLEMSADLRRKIVLE